MTLLDDYLRNTRVHTQANKKVIRRSSNHLMNINARVANRSYQRARVIRTFVSLMTKRKHEGDAFPPFFPLLVLFTIGILSFTLSKHRDWLLPLAITLISDHIYVSRLARFHIWRRMKRSLIGGLRSAFYRLTECKIKPLLRNSLPIARNYGSRKGTARLSWLNSYFTSCTSITLITIILKQDIKWIFRTREEKEKERKGVRQSEG